MRKATPKDKELVTEILVSAFAPLTGHNSINFVVKQDEKRVTRMAILMAYLFEKAIRFGEVYLSDNSKACVLLKYSHKEKLSLKMIMLDFKLAIKCIGIRRVFKVLKRQRLANLNYPQTAHIRPLITGVKSDVKGGGTAARLMLEVKNRFQDNELPVIVDAASEKNAKLYTKFGFRMIKKDETLGYPIYFLRLN